MTLTLAQIHVQPADSRGNLARAARAIADAAAAGADAVLLPEALDCGWTHPSALEAAGPIPGGDAFETLREAAHAHRVFVCAGLVERDGARLFNAAVFVSPDGEILLHHRKLNELAFARSLYACGDRLGVAETAWGRIGLMICADGFIDGHVVSRTLGQMGARLILSPCAWAVPPGRDLRADPYGQLWRDSYGPVCREFGLTIAGCSNIGPVTEGEWRGWRCIGGSMVIGPDGATLAEAPAGDAAEMSMNVRVL